MLKCKHVSVSLLSLTILIDLLLLFQSFLTDSNGSAASLFYISIRTSFQILAHISLSWSDGHLGQPLPVSLLSLIISLSGKRDKLV